MARLPEAIIGVIQTMGAPGQLGPFGILILLAFMIAVIGFIVLVERGQRRIPVQYAKRVVGRRMYGGQTTHLPLKINTAGVIPPIFASSIIMFPATIANFMDVKQFPWVHTIVSFLSPGSVVYELTFVAFVIFFCYFYTAVHFNPVDVADNMKKYGGFIPGIRPGDHTARYIDGIMSRLTLAGAVYITLVCLLPEFLIRYFHVPFTLGVTSLLIIVVVTMDFMAQVQAHMMSHQYEGLMKKANLKGYGNTGLS